MVLKNKILFSSKKFKELNESLANYFLTNYKFVKNFDFVNFDLFFRILFKKQTDLSTEFTENLFLYINILFDQNYFDKYAYAPQYLYTLLFTIYLEESINKVEKEILLKKLDTLYEECEISYEKHYYTNDNVKIPLPLKFYKLLDEDDYKPIIKEFLSTYQVNLMVEDSANMLEVLENKDFVDNPFILKLLKHNEKVIDHMISHNDIPIMLLEISIRDKNQEIIEYLIKKYVQFIQYDDTFEVLCQVKDIDISFLKSIFDKIKEEKYEHIPQFVDDENGINYMIHRGNEDLVITYMNMVQLQNYTNYINQGIEKKMFKFIDYLCNQIQQIDSTYFQSPYFLKKLNHTTLFYNESDFKILNTLFAKYGIPEKKNDFNFVSSSGDVCDSSLPKGVESSHRCQICLEENAQNENLLSCVHCKKAFHINCIFEYMKSKQKEIVDAHDQELAESAEVIIDINQYQDDTESIEVEEENVEDDTESIEVEEVWSSDEEEQVKDSNEVKEEEETVSAESVDENGYVGTYPIVEKDDIMVIYSKMYKNLKCVHCRGSFC
jgi:hypothetical protein